MGFLLDTHVFIWWLQDHARLSRKLRVTLGDSRARVFVSAISIWEIAIKMSLGKFVLRGIETYELGNLPEACGFSSLSLSAVAAANVFKLPFHHHDPFDRALIAQAQTETLVLVTHDDKLSAYDVQVLHA